MTRTTIAIALGLVLTIAGVGFAQQPADSPQAQAAPPSAPPAPGAGGMGPMHGMHGDRPGGPMAGGMMDCAMMGGMMGGGHMHGMMGGMAGPMDPKTRAQMLQMRGEMLKAVGEVMVKYGKLMETR